MRKEEKRERTRARARTQRGRFANFLGEEKLDYEIQRRALKGSSSAEKRAGSLSLSLSVNCYMARLEMRRERNVTSSREVNCKRRDSRLQRKLARHFVCRASYPSWSFSPVFLPLFLVPCPLKGKKRRTREAGKKKTFICSPPLRPWKTNIRKKKKERERDNYFAVTPKIAKRLLRRLVFVGRADFFL